MATDFSITSDRSSIYGVEFSAEIRQTTLRLYMRYQSQSWIQEGATELRPFEDSLWAGLMMIFFCGAFAGLLMESRRARIRCLYQWSGIWKSQVDKITDISKNRLGHLMVKVRWRGHIEGDPEPWKTLKSDKLHGPRWDDP